MLNLNFLNVEELVFYDQELQKLFPAYMYSIFEQWKISQRVPYLKSLGKQAVLDFLNNINDEQIQLLETYFNEKIIVEKLNYSIAINLKVPLSEVCDSLCTLDGFNNLSTWQDDSNLYITAWR